MELHRGHLTARAIMQSPTKSLSRLELQRYIQQEFPNLSGLAHKNSITKNWFVDIGFKMFSILAINPSMEAEITSLLKAVPSNEELRRINPSGTIKVTETQEQSQLDNKRLGKIYQAIRELLQISNGHTCCISDVKKVISKYSKEMFLYFPGLEDSKRIRLLNFHVPPPSQLISFEIPRDAEEELEKRFRSMERHIKASMRNPQDFEAMIRGELKHGFNIQSDLPRVAVWNGRRKVRQRSGPELPKPPLAKLELVQLAMKNSHMGQLTKRQVSEFVFRHFPGILGGKTYKTQSNALYRVMKLLPSYTLGTTIDIVNVSWTEEGEDEESVFEISDDEDNHHQELRQVKQDDRMRKQEEQSFAEFPVEPVPNDWSSWDQNRNEILIDETWTRDGEDVYYKHEITIVEEDYPEPRSFLNGRPRKKKVRRMNFT